MHPSLASLINLPFSVKCSSNCSYRLSFKRLAQAQTLSDGLLLPVLLTADQKAQ